MRQVSSRAWCRVDFAGGTLDIWPLGLLHPGAVTVNLAIDLAATVKLSPRAAGYRLIAGATDATVETLDGWLASPDTALIGNLASVLALPPAKIEVYSDSPRGGGLGASSAVAVALIAAAERFSGTGDSSVEDKSRLARDVEARMMGLPTGRQDHLSALLGGLLVIAHEPGGERVEKLATDLEELAGSMVVAYSGQSHFSAGNNWRIVRSRLDADTETVVRFQEIAGIARAVADAFRAGDLAQVGALMSAEWRQRRRLADGISTPQIESMLEAAVAAGAWGGKACGAGGGGCIVVLAPGDRRAAVVSALARVAEVLPALPCGRPAEIEVL